MTELYVKIDSVCTFSEYENAQYGSWSKSWSNRFYRASMHKIDYDESVPIDFEVSEGDLVYVVWAEWSYGDSFGLASRGRTEVIHIFKDYELALKAKEALSTPKDLRVKD